MSAQRDAMFIAALPQMRHGGAWLPNIRRAEMPGTLAILDTGMDTSAEAFAPATAADLAELRAALARAETDAWRAHWRKQIARVEAELEAKR